MLRDQWRIFEKEQSANSCNMSTISSIGEESRYIPSSLQLITTSPETTKLPENQPEHVEEKELQTKTAAKPSRSRSKQNDDNEEENTNTKKTARSISQSRGSERTATSTKRKNKCQSRSRSPTKRSNPTRKKQNEGQNKSAFKETVTAKKKPDVKQKSQVSRGRPKAKKSPSVSWNKSSNLRSPSPAKRVTQQNLPLPNVRRSTRVTKGVGDRHIANDYVDTEKAKIDWKRKSPKKEATVDKKVQQQQEVPEKRANTIRNTRNSSKVVKTTGKRTNEKTETRNSSLSKSN